MRTCRAGQTGDGSHACGHGMAVHTARLEPTVQHTVRMESSRISLSDSLWPGLVAHRGDRKSTRLNSVTNAHLVCSLLLEIKKNYAHSTSGSATISRETQSNT